MENASKMFPCFLLWVMFNAGLNFKSFFFALSNHHLFAPNAKRRHILKENTMFPAIFSLKCNFSKKIKRAYNNSIWEINVNSKDNRQTVKKKSRLYLKVQRNISKLLQFSSESMCCKIRCITVSTQGAWETFHLKVSSDSSYFSVWWQLRSAF